MFRLHNFRLFLGRPTPLLPLGLYSKAICGVRNLVLLWSVRVFIFMCEGYQPVRTTPTWTTRVGLSFLAWPIILGLSGKGGSTRSLSSSRLSPQRYLCTQASSPQQGGDTVEDEYYYYYYYHHHHHPYHHHLTFLLLSSLRLFIAKDITIIICYHPYSGYLQLYVWNQPCF